MMSGYDANPIFFNRKKIKIGRPEHLLPPDPTSLNISFFHYSTTPPVPVRIVYGSMLRAKILGKLTKCVIANIVVVASKNIIMVV